MSIESIIKETKDHIPGMNCSCGAYGENECGCPDTDWRSSREVAIENALRYCLRCLKKMASRSPVIYAIIESTQRILQAGGVKL